MKGGSWRNGGIIWVGVFDVDRGMEMTMFPY